MRNFKTLDPWISVMLILGVIITGLIKQDYIWILGYFFVGGWQVISMVTHIIGKWHSNLERIRNTYHWIVFITLTVWAISFIYEPLLMGMLYFLLLVSPFMALFYTILGFREYKAMNQRPLALLK